MVVSKSISLQEHSPLRQGCHSNQWHNQPAFLGVHSAKNSPIVTKEGGVASELLPLPIRGLQVVASQGVFP